MHQAPWVEGENNCKLCDYPGMVHQGGIGAAMDIIRQSPVPVTIICVSPPQNIAAVLEQAPTLLASVVLSACMTVRDDNGFPVRVAMKWRDLDAFEEHLIERLLD